MWKGAFFSAFLLSAITYAVFLWLQPQVPLAVAEMTVVFAVWFGLAILVALAWKHWFPKDKKHALRTILEKRKHSQPKADLHSRRSRRHSA